MSTQPRQEDLNVQRNVPLTLASIEAEEIMGVRRIEWRRIRGRVDRLRNPVANASTWAATFFGLAIAAALSLIPQYAATERAVWAIPVTYVVIGFAVAFTVFASWVHVQMKKTRTDDVQDLCDEMDATEAAYKRAVAAES